MPSGVRMGFGESILSGSQSAEGTVPSSAIGGLSSRQVVFGSPSGGISQISRFQVDSTQNFVVVGGGTSTPLNLLHISSTSTGPAVYPLRLEGLGDANSTATFSAIQLVNTQNLADAAALVELRSVVDSTVAGDRGAAFAVAVSRQGTSQTERLRVGSSGFLEFVPAAGRFFVNSSGHLGIGTTAPTVPLHVDGAVRLISTGANASLSIFGAAGTTQASSYTTVAATSARTFATTAPASTGNYSTFTGVSGAGCAFNTRATMEAFMAQYDALARVVQTMYQDLAGYGLLR